MFKSFVLVALISFSSQLFASKARLESLQQINISNGDIASRHILDERAILLNPAYLNRYKDFVITEWGDDTGNSVDSISNPKAEGGFFRSTENFIFGVYLGAEDATNNQLRSALDSDGFLGQDNRIDLFFGGDAGTRWGMSVFYTNTSEEVSVSGNGFEKKQFAYGLKIGANWNNFETYLHLDLADESEGSTVAGSRWEADFGGTFGMGYSVYGVKLFAELDRAGYEYSTANTKSDYTQDRYLVGAGWTSEVASGARVFLDFYASLLDTEIKSGAKTKSRQVPITIGFEVDANSWLVLRGSIKQDSFGNSKNAQGLESSNRNSTDVAAGATLNFGKLKVDGVIGTTGASREPSTVGSSGVNTKQGILSLDNALARVSASYWF